MNLKKVVVITAVIIALVLMFSYGKSGAEEKPAAYDLGNGYTAVENSVFDTLTQHDMLLDLRDKEIAYYKQTIAQLKELNDKKDNIQESRIAVLKDTLVLKDQVIALKDENIAGYKALYEAKSAEVKKYKTRSLVDKLFVLGLGAYAVSQIDDSATKFGVSGLTLAIVFK